MIDLVEFKKKELALIKNALETYDNDRVFCLQKIWDKDGVRLEKKQLGFVFKEQPSLVHTGIVMVGGDGGRIQYDSIEAMIEDGWMAD